MALHYAPDMNDMSETPCQAYVWQILGDGEDVTGNKEAVLADPNGCPDCKKKLKGETDGRPTSN